MYRRIAALATGVLLAAFALPATPSFAAAGETCANLNLYDDDPHPDAVLARTCISWDDKPDGARWTHYQSKVWNPPNNGPSVIHAWLYDNTGTFRAYHRIEDGQTRTINPGTVGQYTAHFTLSADDTPTYCRYMIPGDFSQTSGPC